MSRTLLIGLALVAACTGEVGAGEDCPPAAPAPAPRRTAAASAELRTMAAELAATRACDELRGKFRKLKDEGVATGTLWIERCEAHQDGNRVSVEIAGRGWRWLSRTREELAADFEVADYVRFELALRGTALADIAYTPRTHVFTAWFSAQGEPDVRFAPLGSIDVEEDGWWAEVVGGAASLTGESPEDRARAAVVKEVKRELRERFAQGLSVTINLCSGDADVGFGQIAKGEMESPGDGRGRFDVQALLQRRGLSITGPYRLSPQLAVRGRVDAGAARVQLVCVDDGEKLAAAFLGGQRAPQLQPLAETDATGAYELRLDPAAARRARRAGCRQVVVAARPLRDRAPARLGYDVAGPSEQDEPMVACRRGAPNGHTGTN